MEMNCLSFHFKFKRSSRPNVPSLRKNLLTTITIQTLLRTKMQRRCSFKRWGFARSNWGQNWTKKPVLYDLFWNPNNVFGHKYTYWINIFMFWTTNKDSLEKPMELARFCQEIQSKYRFFRIKIVTFEKSFAFNLQMKKPKP